MRRRRSGRFRAVEGLGVEEDVCVGGTSDGGGRGSGTSFAAAAPATAASAQSPPAGTTNMGANRGICGPS
uniref:Uncharacterized protein n=1 Tax=Tanacetum cinerariifolium TaxID=118510 RepID=A0A699RUI7_TANCI|nr:hypothetical protein [Tanacetum cinerariifolium]